MSLELLKKEYSQKEFETFLKDIFKIDEIDTRFKSDGLNKNHLEHIDSYKFIGRTRLSDRSRLGFFVFKSKNKNIEKKRVGFNAIIPSLTKNHVITHALVAIFHEDSAVWRLSYVSFNTKDGKQSLNTSIKRYTYELGSNIPIKTAENQIKQLLDSQNITKKLLEDVFSVEKLNSRFFADYKRLFENLNSYLLENNFSNFKQNRANIKAFSKKLLGRITFLYFLQKKGWLGVKNEWGDGDRDFLRITFRNIDKEKNFYEDYLKGIFFEALSKKRVDDKFKLLDCKIPFLNGGLFEKKEFDNEFLMIDNSLFEEIFKTLSAYNFTIVEDTPHESEVAVDPEMLGKIFEDLLEDRKDKGAFYTPREIVHYMCQHSIEEYLKTKPKNIDEISYLKHIKILDPAIGSGAFPMGMLHELIIKREELGDTTPIAELKRDIIQNSIYGIDIEPSAVEIAKLRFWLSIVVDEIAPTPLPNLAYKIMVGNSLLSTINGFDPLVQNQNKKAQKDIRILQGKFHDYFNEHNKKRKEKIDREVKEGINLILNKALKNFDIQPKFDMDKKEQNRYENDYMQYMLLSKIIKEYNDYNYTKELFFYKIYFRDVIDSGGFDIVIGNPPYVRHEKIKELKPKLKIEGYKSYNGTADLYIYFFEQGYRLLKDNGILSYITSNKYTRAKYGKQFRAFILNNTNILEYIDFNGVKVFDSATVDTSILTFKKSNVKKSSFLYCDINEKYKKESELEKFISQNGFEYLQSDLSENSFSFSSPEELKIKKIIEKVGTPLKDWDIEINSGIKTGLNEAFIIDGKVKDELIAKDPKSIEIIKPLLRGRDIKRYSYKFADKWLINSHNNPPIDINKYPAIKEYLDKYYDKLEKRSDKGVTPYNLRNCAYLNKFEQDKIIYSEIVQQAQFYLDKKHNYIEMTAFILSGTNLKYIVSFLNSKPVTYFFKKFYMGTELGKKGYRYKKSFLEQLPIPKISKAQQKPFEILVDYILLLKTLDNPINEYVSNEHIAKSFEEVIDAMVYELYFKEEFESKLISFEKEKGYIKFIEYAKEDYLPIDGKNEQESIEIINQSYKRLKEPYNKIRNNLILIDIEFSDLIKSIKGGC